MEVTKNIEYLIKLTPSEYDDLILVLENAHFKVSGLEELSDKVFKDLYIDE